MNQRRRYSNPPIQEAFCEFRFVPGSDWDFTIPEKLQAALGNEYSGKSREQKALQVELSVKDGQPANLSYEEGVAKVQLVTEGGNRLVGVGPNVLSIHMLRPYQSAEHIERGGWEEFRPRIMDALETYLKIVEGSAVSRVGVRYINRILIPGQNVEIEEYLNCAHMKVKGLPENYSNFLSRVEYMYDDAARLVVSYGLLGASESGVECLLDLDAIRDEEPPIGSEQASILVDALHERVGSAFEAIVTDKTRRIFDAA